MGTAADDLREREESEYEDHVLGFCRVWNYCQYCDREREEQEWQWRLDHRTDRET
jgi:hypothetical protein